MHLQTFMRGIAVGFILGILYAPDRGDETRRRISKKASDIKDAVKGTYETVSNAATKIKNKTNELMKSEPDEYPGIPSIGNQSGVL